MRDPGNEVAYRLTLLIAPCLPLLQKRTFCETETVVARMDTPKYGETLKVVYIKYQSILVKSCQRFTKYNYGVTRTIYES